MDHIHRTDGHPRTRLSVRTQLGSSPPLLCPKLSPGHQLLRIGQELEFASHLLMPHCSVWPFRFARSASHSSIACEIAMSPTTCTTNQPSAADSRPYSGLLSAALACYGAVGKFPLSRISALPVTHTLRTEPPSQKAFVANRLGRPMARPCSISKVFHPSLFV